MNDELPFDSRQTETAVSEENSPLTFEAALAELEKTVAKMEAGQLPLEELILCFERGSKLAAECRAKLDSLERKIEILTRDDGKGGSWSDFESDAE